MEAASELLKLAEEKFGKLTAAEKKLFRAAAEGKIADYSPRSKKPIDPANAAKWGPTRVLLADRIAWLCTDKQAAQLVTHRGVQIEGARIDEHFDLMFAKVLFPLYFARCKFAADIYFLYAQIAALNMSGTHTGPLSAGGLKVEGPVYLRKGFKAEGEVNLIGAAVGGNLNCSKGEFMNKDGDAFSADGLQVGGSIYLCDGFKAEGEVRLLGAAVGGNLDCHNAQFTNKDESDNKDKSDVRVLFDAPVDRDLTWIKGRLVTKGKIALLADGLNVEGNVFLNNGFMAEGEVRLPGATIGGCLDCCRGQFINETGTSLSADEVKVHGSTFLREGFKVQGTASFVGARIRGHFGLSKIDSPGRMTLDLNSAKIGTLHDKEDSWPAPKHLVLHGLEYREISHESPRDSKTRIEWVRRQKGFSPQPYEQLAKVLRESGDGAGARDVLVAKNKDKANRTELTRAEWLWYRLFGPLIGYGHKPWLAIPLALVIVLFGSMFFKEGYSHGLVTPPSESAYAEDNTGTQRISEVYPVFNSFMYSLDVFVPVVDLHQAKYWLPNANRGCELVPTSSAALCTGGVLLFWLWIETALGWILTTLFLVGVTGLVRT